MRDKEFGPRIDEGYWKALPLETWFLEEREREKMGSRNYMSPFGTYANFTGGNAEIGENDEWPFLYRKGRKQPWGSGRSRLL